MTAVEAMNAIPEVMDVIAESPLAVALLARPKFVDIFNGRHRPSASIAKEKHLGRSTLGTQHYY